MLLDPTEGLHKLPMSSGLERPQRRETVEERSEDGILEGR